MLLLHSLLRAKVMLLGVVLLGRSLEARQRLKAAESIQGLFDVRPDQVGKGDVDGVIGNLLPDRVDGQLQRGCKIDTVLTFVIP